MVIKLSTFSFTTTPGNLPTLVWFSDFYLHVSIRCSGDYPGSERLVSFIFSGSTVKKRYIPGLVFALYNQNRKIGILLTVTLSGGFVMSVILAILTVHALDFDGACNAPGSPNEAAYLG